MATDETHGSLDETLAPTDSPRRARPARLLGLDARYVDLGPLAVGGMGELHRIRDTRFGRVIVIKVLKPNLAEQADAQRRFEHEARVTALLEHPGVVAVHDRGRLWDGRPWFAMQEVRGRTLGELIDAINLDAPPNRFNPGLDGWTFRRLVDALGRVARTVAYAHERQVVHRDIKPDNIMVGAFGEVLVMDWGIAWEISEAAPEGIIGTPAFMAPEQAEGRPIGPSADVYALGATLYALMAGRSPYQTLSGVLEGPPLAVTQIHPQRRLPAPLVEICAHAMARDAADRPSAKGMARALEDWLDGVARREKAMAMIAEADALRPAVDALHAQSTALADRAQAALAALPARAPVEEKYEAWQLEAEARDQARAAELADVDYLQALRGALNLVSDLSEARERLADHHRRALSRAEKAARPDAVARHEALLRAYDDGQHARWLDGDGAVTLFRVVERHRRRVLQEVGAFGTTPLDAAPLPRGNWVLRVAHPHRAPVDYPVRIDRGEHWDGVAPNARGPTPIYLPAPGEVGEDGCYVPAGWFTAGGDPAAADSLSRRQIWLDGFVMGRNPVTHGEYLTFLQAMVDAGEAEVIARLAPRISLGAGDRTLCVADASGQLALMPDDVGRQPDLHKPVVRVTALQANAYLRWRSGLVAHQLRLPHELEWAKAARGVDGRFFSWGSHFEENWAWSISSQSGQPWLADVDRHPVDKSPYGVLGMTGNSRDWCRNAYARAGEPGPRIREPHTDITPDDLLMVRGGSWNSAPAYCRLAVRFAMPAELGISAVGFRWSYLMSSQNA